MRFPYCAPSFKLPKEIPFATSICSAKSPNEPICFVISDTDVHNIIDQCHSVIENLKQCSYLKCSYLKMGSHVNALAVSFFRRCAGLRSHAHDFHYYSIEKRCGKLGRYVSFNEIHVLYYYRHYTF